MKKSTLVISAIFLGFCSFIIFSENNSDKTDPITLAYIQSYKSQFENYSVSCKYKKLDEREWVACRGNPVKNIGLWEISQESKEPVYLAVNGKALTAMNRFKSASNLRGLKSNGTKSYSKASPLFTEA